MNAPAMVDQRRTIVSIEQAGAELDIPAERLAPWLRSKGLVRVIAGEERVSLRALEATFHDSPRDDASAIG